MSDVQAISQLSEDFSEGRQPFSEAELPEKWALAQVDDASYELAVLSYGVMLDYNRNAKQLWENIVELYQHDRSYFRPDAVVDKSVSDMQHLFEDIGFRYHHRDAEGWHDNSRILVSNHNGNWWSLLEHGDFDALRLKRVIETEGFKYLKGAKLCPFYLKVVDANITSLERVWELSIPVDTHIRRLTQELAGASLTDDEIRAYWREVGQEHDVDAMAADTALWLIGNNWDSWGQRYWEGIN